MMMMMMVMMMIMASLVVEGDGLTKIHPGWRIERGEALGVLLMEDAMLGVGMVVLKRAWEIWKLDQLKGNQGMASMLAQYLRLCDQVQIIVLDLVRNKRNCSVCHRVWQTCE